MTAKIINLDQETNLSTSQRKLQEVQKLLLKQGKYRYNVATNVVEHLPSKGKAWSQVDEKTLLHLARKSLPMEVGGEYINDLLSSKCFAKPYNPITECLERLETQAFSLPFEKYDPFGNLSMFVVLKNDTEEEVQRFDRALKSFFVTAVRCIYEPYHAPKQCLSLMGGQSIGKTPFLLSLLPTELLTFWKKIGDCSTKDTNIALTSNIFCIIDEIDDWLKNPNNRYNYKAFFSTTQVNERLPYGKTPVKRQRIASFVATCNTADFLNDPTGTTRWVVFEIDGFVNKKTHSKYAKLPFNCQDVKFRSVVEACWGEAMRMYKDGYDCELSDNELGQNEHLNEKYKYNSMEFELLAQHLSSSEKNEAGSEFMTATQICQYLNSLQDDVKFTSAKLGKALVRCGFEKKQRRINQSCPYGYYVKKITN